MEERMLMVVKGFVGLMREVEEDFRVERMNPETK